MADKLKKRATTAPRATPRRSSAQMATLRAFNGGNKRVASRAVTRQRRR